MKKSYLILSRLLDLYSTRRLFEEAQKIYSTQVFHPESSDLLSVSTETTALLRLGLFRFQETMNFLQRLSPSISFVNSCAAFAKARSKAASFRFFQEHRLPTPKSFLIENFSFTNAAETVASLEETELANEWPLVLKKVESSQGRGIYLVREPQEAMSVLRSKFREETLLLIQKMHTECWGEDLRIFALPGENVSLLRKSTNGDFRSNLSLGGQGFKTSLSTEEEILAQKVLALFELEYAGIDFLRTPEGPLILEVNPCPGLQGIEKITTENLAAKIVRLSPQI